MSEPTVSNPPVSGEWDPAFQSVTDAFRTNFTDDGEWGGAVCAIIGGRQVVDLWGGFLDWEQTRPWQRDQIVNIYSSGKGLVSMLALHAVERGELELDQPVSQVWPEFAAAGKESVSLRMLLSHQAGLPAIRPRLEPGDKYNWDLMCKMLAKETPFWSPGSAHGYHVNTFGFLVGETLRRATGQSIGELLHDRLAGPADADF